MAGCPSPVDRLVGADGRATPDFALTSLDRLVADRSPDGVPPRNSLSGQLAFRPSREAQDARTSGLNHPPARIKNGPRRSAGADDPILRPSFGCRPVPCDPVACPGPPCPIPILGTPIYTPGPEKSSPRHPLIWSFFSRRLPTGRVRIGRDRRKSFRRIVLHPRRAILPVEWPGARLPKSPEKRGGMGRRTVGKPPSRRPPADWASPLYWRVSAGVWGCSDPLKRRTVRPLDSPRGGVEYWRFPEGSRSRPSTARRRWSASGVRRGPIHRHCRHDPWLGFHAVGAGGRRRRSDPEAEPCAFAAPSGLRRRRRRWSDGVTRLRSSEPSIRIIASTSRSGSRRSV